MRVFGYPHLDIVAILPSSFPNLSIFTEYVDTPQCGQQQPLWHKDPLSLPSRVPMGDKKAFQRIRRSECGEVNGEK